MSSWNPGSSGEDSSSALILLLELFIGALQAYIFTVLTAQYVSTSIAEAH